MFSIPTWFIYTLLGAIFAAFSTIFAKIGLQGINSITVTTFRSIKDYIFIILGS